jgi:hypothetical protein
VGVGSDGLVIHTRHESMMHHDGISACKQYAAGLENASKLNAWPQLSGDYLQLATN